MGVFLGGIRADMPPHSDENVLHNKFLEVSMLSSWRP